MRKARIVVMVLFTLIMSYTFVLAVLDWVSRSGAFTRDILVLALVCMGLALVNAWIVRGQRRSS